MHLGPRAGRLCWCHWGASPGRSQGHRKVPVACEPGDRSCISQTCRGGRAGPPPRAILPPPGLMRGACHGFSQDHLSFGLRSRPVGRRARTGGAPAPGGGLRLGDGHRRSDAGGAGAESQSGHRPGPAVPRSQRGGEPGRPAAGCAAGPGVRLGRRGHRLLHLPGRHPAPGHRGHPERPAPDRRLRPGRGERQRAPADRGRPGGDPAGPGLHPVRFGRPGRRGGALFGWQPGRGVFRRAAGRRRHPGHPQGPAGHRLRLGPGLDPGGRLGPAGGPGDGPGPSSGWAARWARTRW